MAGDEDRGDGALGEAGAEVGGDEYGPPRQPVSHGPADEQQRELGDHVGRQDDAEVPGPAGTLQHSQRQGRGSHRASQQRHHSSGEEPPERQRRQRPVSTRVRHGGTVQVGAPFGPTLRRTAQP